MRASRLISIVLLLQPMAAQLADERELSVRAVYRLAEANEVAVWLESSLAIEQFAGWPRTAEAADTALQGHTRPWRRARPHGELTYRLSGRASRQRSLLPRPASGPRLGFLAGRVASLRPVARRRAPLARWARDRVTAVTPPGAEHLDSRHRDTVRQIFEHPTSHNIDAGRQGY